jgi:hypothetical protein
MPAWGGYAGGYTAEPYAGSPPGPVSPQQQQEALKQQAEYLQQSLDDINKRIEELENEESE